MSKKHRFKKYRSAYILGGYAGVYYWLINELFGRTQKRFLADYARSLNQSQYFKYLSAYILGGHNGTR